MPFFSEGALFVEKKVKLCLFNIRKVHFFMNKSPQGGKAFFKFFFYVENALFLGKVLFILKKVKLCHFFFRFLERPLLGVKICLFKIRNAFIHEKCPFSPNSALKLKSAPFKRRMPSFSSFLLFFSSFPLFLPFFFY